MGSASDPDSPTASLASPGLASRSPRTVGGNTTALLGLSHVQKSPNWSFAGKPPPDPDKAIPGPGTYVPTPTDQTSRHQKASHFSFGTSAREVLSRVKIPGPGAYSPPSGFGRQGGFSMPERRKEKPSSNTDTPAPGNYNVSPRLGEGPKFTVAGKQKDQRPPEQPGPGNYDAVPGDATGERMPRCCFHTATAAAPASISTAGPGPGAYSPGAYIETARFTMKARPREPKIVETPGPGAHGGHLSTLGDYRPAQPRPIGLSPRGAAGIGAAGVKPPALAV